MKASTDAFSIADGYEDALGVWRPLAPRTRAALRAAMGAEGNAPPPAHVIVARTGERRNIAGPGRIVLEDGRTLDVERSLPPDLPPGYHSLALRADVEPTRLIVAPRRCALPARRGWGWAAQLYATRSTASWGIGDLADLRRLGAWATGLGASLLLINPLYLRIEEIPGAAALGADLERLTAVGRALNGERRIDRARVFALKSTALEQLWRHDGGGDPAFDDFVRRSGRALHEFATFSTLAERYGGGFRAWPAEYRRPDASPVAAFADAHAGRVRFHQWLQWHLDIQLARACAAAPVMQDLPIGVDPDGADAWA